MGALARLASFDPRTPIGWFLRLPLRMLPSAAIVTVRSGLNRGAKWIVGASTHACWLGHYETEKQAALSRILREGGQFWDVGANAGFYSLAAARIVGPKGRVLALEPLAENVLNITRHLMLNNVDNVVLVQAVV